MHFRSTSLFLLGAVWLVLQGPAYATVVSDEFLGFKLTLPPGFAEFPEGKQQLPGTQHAYAKGELGSNDFAILGIESLGGTIGRERLKPSDLPSLGGIDFGLRQAEWRGFEIDVFAGRTDDEHRSMFVLVAQIPLKRQAIQLKLVGPAEREAELVALLSTLLAALEGESNWLSKRQRWSAGIKASLGFCILAIALLSWWRLRRRSEKP